MKLRGLVLPSFKCKRGSNTCPFCRVKKPTIRSLIDHCLEEILDNVRYQCIMCGVSYGYSNRRKMRSSAHICWRNDQTFRFARQYYSVDGVKGLLAPQGIRGSTVDDAVEIQNFRVPGPHEMTVDSAAEKRLLPSPPVNSVNKTAQELPLPPVNKTFEDIGRRLQSLATDYVGPPQYTQVNDSNLPSLPVSDRPTMPVRDRLLGEAQVQPTQFLINYSPCTQGAPPPFERYGAVEGAGDSNGFETKLPDYDTPPDSRQHSPETVQSAGIATVPLPSQPAQAVRFEPLVDLTLGDSYDLESSSLVLISSETAEQLDFSMRNPQAAAATAIENCDMYMVTTGNTAVHIDGQYQRVVETNPSINCVNQQVLEANPSINCVNQQVFANPSINCVNQQELETESATDIANQMETESAAESETEPAEESVNQQEPEPVMVSTGQPLALNSGSIVGPNALPSPETVAIDQSVQGSVGLSGDSQSPAGPSAIAVQAAAPDSKTLDSESGPSWYPPTWMAKCFTKPEDIGVLVLTPAVTTFYGSDFVKYIKFPAWHKATGCLVYVLAPAVNHSEDSILRDCPQLMKYRPMIPEDLPSKDQIVAVADLGVQAVLLQSNTAGYDKMSLS